MVPSVSGSEGFHCNLGLFQDGFWGNLLLALSSMIKSVYSWYNSGKEIRKHSINGTAGEGFRKIVLRYSIVVHVCCTVRVLVYYTQCSYAMLTNAGCQHATDTTMQTCNIATCRVCTVTTDSEVSAHRVCVLWKSSSL